MVALQREVPMTKENFFPVVQPSFRLAAVILPMVTLTTAALAEDDKTYPGAMCRMLGAPNTLADTPALGANGSMLNFSRAEQVWICPVVRDHMEEDPEYARITVQENGINPVKCEFEARDTIGKNSVGGGTPSILKQENLTTNPLTIAVLYTWGAEEIDALAGVPDHGYYFFRCVVPGRTDDNRLSGVITYKVSEND
jgi:hypothetical protein